MILQDIRKTSIYLMMTMSFVSLLTLGIGITLLYNTAISAERERLIGKVQSRASLMNAVAKFDKEHSGAHALDDTLSQIKEARKSFEGFGETGDFLLANLKDNQIVYLLNHRGSHTSETLVVDFDDEVAEPMRRALKGQSGVITDLDYRGELVVAAYTPVEELHLGMVAKIDLKEVRAPFIQAAYVSLISTLLVIFVGLLILRKITAPLEVKLITAIKSISAIVPLCAWCGTSIQNKNGDWVHLEEYLESVSDSKVSHGICPTCAQAFKSKNNMKV